MGNPFRKAICNHLDSRLHDTKCEGHCQGLPISSTLCICKSDFFNCVGSTLPMSEKTYILLSQSIQNRIVVLRNTKVHD